MRPHSENAELPYGGHYYADDRFADTLELFDVGYIVILSKSMLLSLLLVAAQPFFLRAQAKQPTGDRARMGQKIFSSTCAGCHGLDGRGGEHAPNIATSPKVQQLADSDIVRIVDKGIPAAGMPAFGTSLKHDQIEAVVSYLRTLGGRASSQSVAGDPKKGRALFYGGAQCGKCHMMNGVGGFIGSDLSSYGTNHSAAQIRGAILDPAKNAGSSQKPVIVTARDGRKYSGILRNEDNFSLQLQSLDGTFHLLEKSSVERVEPQAKSLMPDNYASTLSASDIDNLVSYVANAKGQAAGADSDDEF